ncbi:MAG: hypothetical protein DRO04_01775, partial [Candidatus Iainarchaeum archaeon]
AYESMPPSPVKRIWERAYKKAVSEQITNSVRKVVERLPEPIKKHSIIPKILYKMARIEENT